MDDGAMNQSGESSRKTDSFRDLLCWQDCRALRLYVVKTIVPRLPPTEKFRLVDQLIRAARSTTANIAEGYGRFHFLDEAKFCSNARGSCFEVIDHAITANDEGLISTDILGHCEQLANTAIRRINGYMAYLKRRSKGPFDDSTTPLDPSITK